MEMNRTLVVTVFSIRSGYANVGAVKFWHILNKFEYIYTVIYIYNIKYICTCTNGTYGKRKRCSEIYRIDA